jgi:hypothetical protein
VLALLGLSIYSLTRRMETGPPYSLDPLDSTRGELSKIEEVKLPATLLLRSQASTLYEEYVAKIQDLEGRDVRRFPGLHQDNSFVVELKLYRGDLPPGEYRLDLVGLRSGRPEEVTKYRFRIPKQE